MYKKSSIAFCKNYFPIILLIFSWGFVFLCHKIGSVVYPPLRYVTIVFVFSCVLWFLWGYLVGVKVSATQKQLLNRRINEEVLFRKVGYTICILSLLSIFLSILYYLELGIFYGSYDLKGIIEANRKNINEVYKIGIRASWSGVGMRILYGCPIVFFAVLILRYEELGGLNRNLLLALSLFLLIVTVFFGFLSGSGRNDAAMSIMYAAFVMIIRVFEKKSIPKMPPKFITAFVSFLIMSSMYMMFLFVEREHAISRGLSDVARVLKETYSINITINMDQNYLSDIKMAYIMFITYITHAVHELNLLLTGYKPIKLLWGQHNFFNIFVLLKKFGFDFIDPVQLSYYRGVRLGTYKTLFGDLFIDWGIAGSVIFMGGLGVFIGYIHNIASRLRLLSVSLLASYNLLILFFSPFYSVFCTGNGLSLLIAILIIFLIEWHMILGNKRRVIYDK